MKTIIKYIGLGLIALGFLVILLGGIFITVYSIWDIIQNIDHIGFWGIFTNIFMIIIKDIIAIVVGIIIIGIGTLMAGVKAKDLKNFKK